MTTIKEITVETKLYLPGCAFRHHPSESLMVITQDAQHLTQYYVTTLFNRATPSQNFTTHKVLGTRPDGLLAHEIEDAICTWESSPVKLRVDYSL